MEAEVRDTFLPQVSENGDAEPSKRSQRGRGAGKRRARERDGTWTFDESLNQARVGKKVCLFHFAQEVEGKEDLLATVSIVDKYFIRINPLETEKKYWINKSAILAVQVKE